MSTCTFFGHRDAPPSIKPKLREAIVDLIENHNVTNFFVGTHGSFDRMAHSILRELSAEYPHISYAVVLAYLPAHSDDPLRGASDTMLPEGIETVPKRYAVSWRNNWMLRRSDYVIAFVAHPWGGAAQFAEKAKRQGKTVIGLSAGS